MFINEDELGKIKINGIYHIISIYLAKSEEEVLALNHYTSLRPLWGKENVVRSNKLPPLAEIERYGLTGLLTLISDGR